MASRIDQAALDAASAGPNPPPAGRLRAAADYVMDRTRPDQLILFGSAARGEFRERSDFDFLVVRSSANGDEPPERPARWEHPDTGDEIDVLFADADLLEERRWTAGTVHCAILAEGATVFCDDNGNTVKTARDAGEEAAEMARQGKYEPWQAEEFTREARLYMRHADTAAEEEAWGNACRQLQESAERSLEALVIARGSPFSYIHDRVLQAVSTYAGRARYGSQYQENPEELYKAFRPTAEDLLQTASTRVPELLAAHADRKKSERGTSARRGRPASVCD